MVIISPPLVFTLHWSHGHSCDHVTVCLQRINKNAFIPIYFRIFAVRMYKNRIYEQQGTGKDARVAGAY